jgi:hypothetical protein
LTTTASSPATSRAGTVSAEFDLHGIVGVRLLDASPADVAKVTRQLGPLQASLHRDPDITVRFVDSVTSRPVTYAGLGQGGFNEDGFFVLQGKGGVAARAQIPFDRIGRQLEIVCETTMPAVPQLLAIINLTALGKGVLPLHASAFTASDTGLLVTGWAKGGKTESLLACMQEGADYVGDEWVYLSADGQMRGVPEPIRLWSWHLDQLPELLRSRPRKDRWRLATWDRAAALAGRVATTSLPGTSLVRKGSPVIGRQAYLQIPPAELFGADKVRLQGYLDAVVLVASHESPDIVIEAAAPAEVSGRMAASLADERAPFMEYYRQFRYAFPHASSPLVDNADAAEARLLARLLDPVPSAKVLHPYRCDIAALGRAVTSAARYAIDNGGHRGIPASAEALPPRGHGA